MNGGTIQVLSQRQTLKAIGKAHPQVRFLEDIEQFDHRPACSEFCFEQPQVLGLGLGRQRREGDPAIPLGQQAHVRVVGDGLVKLFQGCGHLSLQLVNEDIGV